MTMGLVEDRTKDMCPICKTDRYLSPNMNFLINPECYHKICESCVDRIFSLGPAPCPYPGCGKTLRKNKFKKQVFEDIEIEREIDIRKKVFAIYNKTEEDFETLQDFNQYLESVEDIIFNLTNKIDYEETETKLIEYEKEHRIDIIERNIRESQKNSDLIKYQEAKERLKQEKFRFQKQLEMEDLQYQKQQKEELLDSLSNSGASSEELIKQQKENMLKRATLRKQRVQQMNNTLDSQFNQMNPLNHKVKEELVVPFTPFQGDRELKKNYELLPIPEQLEDILEADAKTSDSYFDPYVINLAKNKEYLAAGWRAKEVYERALDEAFLGLGCFIEKEKVTA